MVEATDDNLRRQRALDGIRGAWGLLWEHRDWTTEQALTEVFGGPLRGGDNSARADAFNLLNSVLTQQLNPDVERAFAAAIRHLGGE